DTSNFHDCRGDVRRLAHIHSVRANARPIRSRGRLNMKKVLSAAAAMLGILLVIAGGTAATTARRPLAPRTTIPADVLTQVVKRYCQRCHNDELRRGNLSLRDFDV